MGGSNRDVSMRALGVCAAALLIGLLVAVRAAPSQAPADHIVTQATMDGWKKTISNWGRWGADDQKGTLNLITPAKRLQAAALVKDGTVVSLARDADTEASIENDSPYEQVMRPVGPSSSGDRLSVYFHGLSHTHLDALGHHFMDGKLYNGFPRDQYVTTQGGATKGAIINVKDGIFTRGILVDIPRLKGVPYLEPGTPIYAEDLEAWEKMAGIRIGSGDAVFIRTGRWTRRARLGPWNIREQAAGLDASVLPWIRQRDIAVLGSEAALSVTPKPATTRVTNPDDSSPVHHFVIYALGMNLFDDCDLDALAAAAAARTRWEFLLTAAPLPIVKGTGSPINPTAVF